MTSWGPILWKIIHTIAFNSPENISKIDYINFYKSIENIIPCSICKHEYSNKLRIFPLNNYFKSKLEIEEWTIKIHNSINRINKKKEYNYYEVIKIYKNNNVMKEILIFLIIIHNNFITNDFNQWRGFINFIEKLKYILNDKDEIDLINNYLNITYKIYPNNFPNYIIFKDWLKGLIIIFLKKYTNIII